MIQPKTPQQKPVLHDAKWQLASKNTLQTKTALLHRQVNIAFIITQSVNDTRLDIPTLAGCPIKKLHLVT
jgi:hypothetical protein